MKLHQIDLKTGQWLGASKTVADTSPIPRGWIVSDADPLPGQRWGGSRGWIGEPIAVDAEAKRAALEAAYHAIIANSICSLQSQTAWLAAVVLGAPCNMAKISECKAWADRAWAQYQIDKANGLTVPTFNEPQPSYTFTETMTP